MTASELFALVERVDREAWPAQLAFEDGNWYRNFGPSFAAQVHSDDAALMFTGSMVVWLLERGVTVHHIPGVRQFWTVRTDEENVYTSRSMPALLEALAAACKEMKGEQDE